MQELGYVDSMTYYCNYTTRIINQIDMMLADFDGLEPEQVQLVETVKNKFMCIQALIKRNKIVLALRLEEDAILDIADVLNFMGFNQAADQMIEEFPFCLS